MQISPKQTPRNVRPHVWPRWKHFWLIQNKWHLRQTKVKKIGKDKKTTYEKLYEYWIYECYIHECCMSYVIIILKDLISTNLKWLQYTQCLSIFSIILLLILILVTIIRQLQLLRKQIKQKWLKTNWIKELYISTLSQSKFNNQITITECITGNY